jgi:hypothetical protein
MPNFSMPPLAEAPAIEWECLGKGSAELASSSLPYAAPIHTFRSCVPGGWLVLVMTGGNDPTVTFMPDPFHEWTGRSLRSLG